MGHLLGWCAAAIVATRLVLLGFTIRATAIGVNAEVACWSEQNTNKRAFKNVALKQDANNEEHNFLLHTYRNSMTAATRRPVLSCVLKSPSPSAVLVGCRRWGGCVGSHQAAPWHIIGHLCARRSVHVGMELYCAG